MGGGVRREKRETLEGKGGGKATKGHFCLFLLLFKKR